jgi:hypothetical protein
MNLNSLSDDELLRYLDKYSDDPVMKRVVDILMDKQQGIISDLVAAGMDPQYWTFRPDGYNEYYPGQYVSHLESEIDCVESELSSAQYELDDVNAELRKLKARTVAELIAELNEELTVMASARDQARFERDRAIQNEKTTKEKMKVWTAISTDVSR